MKHSLMISLVAVLFMGPATGSMAEPINKPKSTIAEQQGGTAADRLEYARKVEQILLEIGMSADVSSVEINRYSYTPGPTPLLLLFGSFSKAYVFQLTKEGYLLRTAKALGFRTVDFFDRGPDGHYVFDLSRDVPRCAKYNRVCW